MATEQDYLRAAAKADAAGDVGAARALVAQARKARADFELRLGESDPNAVEPALYAAAEFEFPESIEDRAARELEEAQAAREAAQQARANFRQSVGAPAPAEAVALDTKRDPRSGVIPMYRPSRIRNIAPESVEVGRRLETIVGDPLREGLTELNPNVEEVTEDYGTAEPRDEPRDESLPNASERMYWDPETGTYRRPTAFEEMVEAFAQQQVLSEDEAKDLQAQYALGKEKPMLRNILSTRGAAGMGIVETPLTATLRGLGTSIEAAGTEAYFRGLGYEVDDEGNPLDPKDFGYKVAQARRKLTKAAMDEFAPADYKDWLPSDTISGPGPVVKLAGQTVGRGVRALGETYNNPQLKGMGEGIERLTEVPIPLPGVATQRERGTLKPNVVDPQARRPAGSSDSVIENYAQTLAAGRGLGDEYIASPALMRDFKRLYGDDAEIAAFVTGTVLSLAIPGPGEVAGMMRLPKVAQVPAKALQNYVGKKAVTREARRILAPLVDDTVSPANPTGRRIIEVADNVIESGDADIIADEWRRLMQAETSVHGKSAAEIADAAEALRGRLKMKTPTTYVRLGETVAVPAAQAPIARQQLRAAMPRLKTEAAARVPPNGTKFAQELEKGVDEFLTSTAAFRAKSLAELDELQVILDTTRRAGLWNLPTMRAFRSLGRTKRASLVDFEQKVRRAGEPMLRKLQDELTEEVLDLQKNNKAAGYEVSEALDTIAKNYIDPADRKGAWSALINDTFGSEALRDEVIQLIERTYNLDLRRIDPSIVILNEILSAPHLARYLAGAGSEAAVVRNTANLLLRAKKQIRKNMIKLIIEEGMRKQIGKNLQADYAEAYENARTPLFDPNDFKGDIVDIGGRKVPVTLTEKELLEGAAEKVAALEAIPTFRRSEPGRALLTGMLRMRKAIAQTASTGWIFPDMSDLTSRLIGMPMLSMVTLGVNDTLKALSRAGKEVIPFNPGKIQQRGLRTPDGTVYTPKELDELANRYGLGITTVEAQRIGSLTDDVLDSVDGILGSTANKAGETALRVLSPFARKFVSGAAHKLEVGYRRAVFFSQLENGMSPRAAAELARKSVLDYSSQSPEMQRLFGTYLVNGAERLELAKTITDLLVRNPSRAISLAKASYRAGQLQDPYGFDGDARFMYPLSIQRLLTNSANRYSQRFLGVANPVIAPIEDALAVGAAIDKVASKDILGAIGGLVNAAADLQSYADGWAAFTSDREAYSRAEEDIRARPKDEALYWRMLQLAQAAPDNAISQMIMDALQPTEVKPPKQWADPEDIEGRTWLALPAKGVVYTYEGRSDVTGEPKYKVWRISSKGKGAISSLRAFDKTVPLNLVGMSESVLPLALRLYGKDQGALNTDAVVGEPSTAGAVAELAGFQPTVPKTKMQRDAELIERATR